MLGPRFYLKRSSWFDTHSYEIERIKGAVSRGSGRNVRTAFQFGWSNQPRVVTWTGERRTNKAIESMLLGIGIGWPIISEKGW